MQWNIATVAGAVLPYKGRRKWYDIAKSIKKGSDYISEAEISSVLDVLIGCGIKGTVIIGDIGHVSLADAEVFRNGWVDPHYNYAQALPHHLRLSMEHHLDNLKGLGSNKLSTQDFVKVILVLETITNFVRWMTKNLRKIRSIDIRKVKFIIDDQAKASLIAIKHFVHYFLQRRSSEEAFNCPPGSLSLLGRYLRNETNQVFLDTTKLLEDILVEEKANQDDVHSELKIADLIANFSRRVFNGSYGVHIAEKLKKIIISVDPVFFGSSEDLEVKLPSQNPDAINVLLGIPRL